MNPSDDRIIDITTGWINVNTGCNNRCKWCYRQVDLATNSQEMPLHMAEQLVDFFIALDIYSCIFIGGEPTLYKKLTDLVSQAKKGGIKELTVVSNGRKYSKKEYVQDLIAAGLNNFSISIHSGFQYIHDLISRVPAWEQTIGGIKNVVSLGHFCSLNVVVGPGNVTSTIDSLKILLDLGVDKIIVSAVIPCVGENGITGEYALDPQDFGELATQIADLDERVVVLHELPLCLIPREPFVRLVEQNRLGFGCHVGLGRGLSVDVDGKVIPCNSFAHHPMIDLFQDGKLRFSPDEFRHVWATDETVKSVRDAVNVYRSEICKECDLWSLCNCGCPMTWGAFNPEDYINDGLLDIKAEDVYQYTNKKYNP